MNWIIKIIERRAKIKEMELEIEELKKRSTFWRDKYFKSMGYEL